MFTNDELNELANVELDDAFIEANVIKRTWDAELAQSIMRGVCDGFVKTFLADDGVATLHELLRDCDQSLDDMEKILRRFIVSLESTQQEIGDVRERLKCVAVELANVRAAERALWDTMSCFMVPPEVVRVVTQCNDDELGPQFRLSAQQILRLLYRRNGSRRPSTSNEPNRVPLAQCRAYNEEREVLDRLTVHACVKTKRFISKKVALLRVANTNVSIQQEHVLKPFAFFVHFLRSVPPLLRQSPHTTAEAFGAEQQLPYRITQTLYTELRREYCDAMSHLYLERVRYYLFTLNSMEHSTQMVQASPRGLGAAAALPPALYILPLLTEAHDAMPPGVFSLGERGAILENVLAAPLVPTVERARRRLHYYEETFRSLNALLSDAVTHEFLFTFTFFSGDMSVFVDVFKPTVQFVVDYVSEVMLDQGNGRARQMLNEYKGANITVNCRHDCYGLLMLIRLCHDFRSFMKDVRRLSCLEGFYDSLLLLLWPAFQRTFERQMLAVRSADVTALLRAMPRCDSVEACIASVHPLTKCYAAFVAALLTISQGCGFDEETLTQETYPSLHTTARGDSVEAEGNGGRTASAPKPFEADAENAATDLRRAAWRAIVAERASDAADSASRFAVLFGNLSFLRVEVVRLLGEVGRRLAASAAAPDRRDALCRAFVLNNVHHILRVWASLADGGHEGSEAAEEVGADVAALMAIKREQSAELVEGMVRAQFTHFCGVIHDAHTEPAAVLAAAAEFVREWRVGLDRMCAEVRCVLGDEGHIAEVLAQLCMEVLLYNTRFHTCVAHALDVLPETEGRPIRALIVTNQMMLQHMRTLATMPEESDSDL